MPWKIEKQGRKFCVVKETDGSTVACHTTKKKANAQIAALNSNVEETFESSSIMLEEDRDSVGPVLSGIAVTNHPALPLPAITIENIDGKDYLRVPFLKQGVFSDPRYGRLVFNNKVFDTIISNHEDGKNHYGVSLNERHIRGKALAWFTSDKGGYIQKEDTKYGKLLVAYGKPTSEENLELIKSGEYRYASAEINPRHKPTMIKQFSISTEDLEEVEKDYLLEEVDMDKVTITQDQYDKIVVLEQNIVEKDNQIKTLNDKIVELEEDMKEDVTLDLPEDVRILLEEQQNEINRLKRVALEADVDKTITNASTYRDETGKGHSALFLNTARAFLLGQDIKVDGEVIVQLEGQSAVDVAKYSKKFIEYLLSSLPGQVKFESENTEEIDNPTPENDNSEQVLLEEGKSLWSETV